MFVKSTERIAIQGGNGGPATLVAHEYGTNNFRAYPITEQGIGNPVISSVGSVHDITNPDDARGYIKFGGDSTGALVAVALDDRVEVFNFDTETLEITDPVTIDFAGRGQPYGIEMASDSSGNTVLYVSTDNGIYGATINGSVEEGQNIPVVLVSGTGGNNVRSHSDRPGRYHLRSATRSQQPGFTLSESQRPGQFRIQCRSVARRTAERSNQRIGFAHLRGVRR